MTSQSVAGVPSSRSAIRGLFLTAAAVACVAGSPAAVAQQNTGAPQTPAAEPPAPEQVRRPAGPTLNPPSRSANYTPPQAVPAQPQQDGARVHVDENHIVDLHVSDENLATVLEMLSIQSQINIVASKNVNARVTANLYGVSFLQALDAILNVNGYCYIQNGNFIYVYTLEECQKIAQASRNRISKTVRLSFLNSTDAAELVKPLLSETGTIKTPGKTPSFPSFGDAPTGADDYAQNAMLVIFDYEENVSEIEKLIAQLDTKPEQVLVESTILNATLTEANAFGVDFAVVANLNFSDFVGWGSPINGPNALISGRSSPGSSTPLPADGGGTAIGSSVGNTGGPGGFKVGVVSNDVAVFLRVLDEVTDSTIISNPKLLCLNRQPGRVLVGRKVGYLKTVTNSNGTSVPEPEFLQVGTELYFRPFIQNDGTIRMELKPKVSDAVFREATDSNGTPVTIPDEITNELTTSVIVRDGQTIVLGGLFREATETTRRQIPYLGDIPIIGAAFRGNDDKTQRQEIIFLITPTVVTDAAIETMGQRSLAQVDNVRSGMREATLPWGAERRTAQLNLEAARLAAEGKTQEALWALERSLNIRPNQPDAIALRESISSKKTTWPNRSMMDNILHAETNAKLGAMGFDPNAFASPAAVPFGNNSNNNTGDGSNPLSPSAEAPSNTNPEGEAQALSDGFYNPSMHGENNGEAMEHGNQNAVTADAEMGEPMSSAVEQNNESFTPPAPTEEEIVEASIARMQPSSDPFAALNSNNEFVPPGQQSFVSAWFGKNGFVPGMWSLFGIYDRDGNLITPGGGMNNNAVTGVSGDLVDPALIDNK